MARQIQQWANQRCIGHYRMTKMVVPPSSLRQAVTQRIKTNGEIMESSPIANSPWNHGHELLPVPALQQKKKHLVLCLVANISRILLTKVSTMYYERSVAEGYCQSVLQVHWMECYGMNGVPNAPLPKTLDEAEQNREGHTSLLVYIEHDDHVVFTAWIVLPWRSYRNNLSLEWFESLEDGEQLPISFQRTPVGLDAEVPTVNPSTGLQ